ncbi:MAG: ACP S-malonyltransferase [Pseudomonadota bacterium]|nr:ACP S-malonyltransferase [Pseudomonadota bacterium]
MKRVLLFPGQGSQRIGMGKAVFDAFPEARQVYEEVNDALNENLSRLMFEGPEEKLTLTTNAQPALMTSSMAIVRVLETQGDLKISDIAAFVAGHSLGEYSALAAGGAITLTDTAQLLRTRGTAMQQAVPVGKGKMAAILGLELQRVEEISTSASTEGVCEVANDNAPGQVVLSGKAEAIDQAIELAKNAGAKRAIPLDVSAPFHCSLLEPAAEKMSSALSKIVISAPCPPLISNVSAAVTSDPNLIRTQLIDQVTQRVRWREIIETVRELGAADFFEIGTGKVLTNLNKRIDKDLTSNSIENPSDIENLLKSL